MLIVREVLAWLRYRMYRDPLCLANGVVLEEIPSSLQSIIDTNDGSRTLAIFKASQGFTPRIEVRFTGLYPQVWYIKPENTLGDYISTPMNPPFPGNTRAWDCSDFVDYLLTLAKANFCSCPSSLLNILTTADKVEAATPKIALEDIERVLSRIKDGIKTDGKVVNRWLKIKKKGDLMDFAKSTIEWFKRGKLLWQDLKHLTKLPGKTGNEVVQWDFYKEQLSDPALLSKLPPPAADLVTGDQTAEASVKSALESVMVDFANGEELALHPMESVVAFGQQVVAQLKAGTLPIHYLSLMEECDPKEAVLPWSYIRRSVIAYETPSAQPVAPESEEGLSEAVTQWLSKSNLISPLYGTEEEKDTVLQAVKRNVDKAATETVGNMEWVKQLFKDLFGIKNEHDLIRSLQGEFDMWLLNVLSPSSKEIPLSPHAFTSEMKQESLFQKVFDAWYYEIKTTAEERLNKSKKQFAIGMEQFYELLTNAWKKDELKGYHPKAPSASAFKEVVTANNREAMFDLLAKDIEEEVGSKVPDDVRKKLMVSAYFNVIFEEALFQSVKLP